MRKLLKKIHLWLGIISGLLVFVIAITGCLYAFQQEIQDATQSYRFTEIQQKAILKPTEFESIARKNLPNRELHSIKIHKSNRSVEAIFYHYEPTYYYIMYLNPYTGEVLHTQNMEEGFFPFVLKGHFHLWLPPEIGQTVVASFTLIFILVLISGFLIWIPKNIKNIRSRLQFQWNATTKWRRKNFDLHAIIGFYSFGIALLFCITGLVWGFQWFANGLHATFGGEKQLEYVEPSFISSGTKNEAALDKLYEKISKEVPNFQSIELHPAHDDKSPIVVNTNTKDGTYYAIDYQYFNPKTLVELPSNTIFSRQNDATFADTLLRMNYDIHTGAILGFAGKFFMFIMSLCIASLPISGIVFWYGKRYKKKLYAK